LLLGICDGANVTSHRAGLSVPDWPTTYGQFMFFFPTSKWVGNILYEHGHRLIASAVGILTIILAFWLERRESRRWVRSLGIVALAAVIAQGILGGLTVRFMLPPSISIAHAGLAEMFFCMTVALALFTSERWEQGPPAAEMANAKFVRGLCLVLTIAVYIQILLGAAVRHAETGLLAHVFGAGLLFACVVASVAAILFTVKQPRFLRNALLLLFLVVVQMALGLATLITRLPKNATEQPSPLQVFLPTAHLALGALILATSLAIVLKTYRFLAPPKEETAMPFTAGALS
jgi:heme a synthase